MKAKIKGDDMVREYQKCERLLGQIDKAFREYGKNRVFLLGDNLNDIPMFELANEAYATANAAEEIKKIATDVIGSCEDNGVAEFLANRFNFCVLS